MGLVGDIIYPDNSDKARELNKEQTTLQNTNALHNELVNNYTELANHIRSFDAYLMAILVMQYYITYTKEDLDNLPDTKNPKITKSIADKIETIALDAISIKMGYNGIKAIGQKIANIVKESGTYKDSISEGEQAVTEELQPELENLATQTDLIRSGNVDLLTDTEATPEELAELADELGTVTEEAGEASEIGEVGEEGTELSETLSAAADGVEAATEAGEAAVEAGEVAIEAGVEGAAVGAGAGLAAILGPAAIVLIVVTEIIGVINAAKTHEKLVKALAQMKNLQTQSDKSIVNLKKAFKSLLNCLKLDIQTYNKVLAKLYQLEGNEIYNKSFSTSGIDSFINGLAAITINNEGNITGYKTAVMNNLTLALTAIRNQAEHDSGMTSVISSIKSHIRQTGNPSIEESFLKNISLVEGIDLKRVKSFNVYRQYISEFASVLAPYHKQVQRETPSGSKLPTKPSNPQFGKPDPNFDPKPGDFQIPGLS